jgi:hypothetical protein
VYALRAILITSDGEYAPTIVLRTNTPTEILYYFSLILVITQKYLYLCGDASHTPNALWVASAPTEYALRVAILITTDGARRRSY